MSKVFVYILGISSSFDNCLFNYFTHLLIGLFVLVLFKFLISWYILDSNCLSVELLQRIFSHSLGCLLILVIVSFDAHEILI
jgi:hypothetical protein